MRSRSLGALAALVASGVFVAVPPAAADEVSKPVLLGISTLTDMVADEHHVFLTDSSDGITVLDLDGSPVTKITGEPAAGQLTLSADGSTLYVVVTDAISVIDTATLTETSRYATGTGTCPTSVAVTSGRLWFGYGCDGAPGQLGSVTSDGTVATELLPDNAPFPSAPRVVASEAKPGLLVLGQVGIGLALVRALDVSGTPALLSSNQAGTDLEDIGLSGDGTILLAKTKGGEQGASFVLPNLDPGTGLYSEAIAQRSDGIAATLRAIGGNDLSVFLDKVSQTITSFRFGNYFTTPLTAGLAFGPASTDRLFIVTEQNGKLELRVLTNAAMTLPRLIVEAATVTSEKEFSFGGQLHVPDLASFTEVRIAVTRDEPDGPIELGSFATYSDGRFSFKDTLAKRGTARYTMRWAGDATHGPLEAQGTVTVVGVPVALTLTAPNNQFLYGQKPVLVAHLGATRNSRVASLYVTPYGGTKTLLKRGTVDAQGNLSAPYTMTRRTTVFAEFSGDDHYLPGSVHKTFLVHAKVASTLSRYYGTSGAYRLYHVATDPLLSVAVSPNQSGRLACFSVDQLVSGSWRQLASSSVCKSLDRDSHSSYAYTGAASAGGTFRIRADYALKYQQDSTSLATTGPTLYWRFTA